MIKPINVCLLGLPNYQYVPTQCKYCFECTILVTGDIISENLYHFLVQLDRSEHSDLLDFTGIRVLENCYFEFSKVPCIRSR